MGFREDALTVLSGGLGALLDDPAADPAPTPVNPPDGSAVNPQRVEEIAPAGTLQDKEPFLMGVSQTQILIGTAAVIGVLALVMLVRR